MVFDDEQSEILLRKLKNINNYLELDKYKVIYYLNKKADPNAKYPDGTSLVTQAINNLEQTPKITVNTDSDDGDDRDKFNERLNVIFELVKAGALLSERDEAKLERLVPHLIAGFKNEIYRLDKSKMLAASHILETEIPGGPNIEAQARKNLKEYMGIIGGKKRRKSRKRRSIKIKRRSIKRNSSRRTRH
jgi:hypothetical protein